MKLFPEKRRFVKSFCALSVMTLMVCSSLSAAAAIVNAAASETVSVPQSTTQAVKPVASALKRVVLDVNGEQSTVLFAGKTVEELLRFAHVDILENRIVAPDLSASVTPFMAVTVRDAKPVEITADGKTRTVKLVYGKLSEALHLAGVTLSDEDILSESRGADVRDIDSLTIQRVTYQQLTEREVLPYQTVTRQTDTLPAGQTQCSVKGTAGEKEVVKSVKMIDGKAVEERLVSEKVTKQPVDEVILVGTKS